MAEFRAGASRKISFAQPDTGEKEPDEAIFQNAIVNTFQKALNSGVQLEWQGDMAAGRRSQYEAMIAKSTGLRPGWPDLTVIFPGPHVVMIELKVKAKGSVRKSQKERHASLRALGMDVRVWRVRSRQEAIELAIALIEEFTDEE